MHIGTGRTSEWGFAVKRRESERAEARTPFLRVKSRH